MKHEVHSPLGYGAGHPWHYVLGGAVPYPKQIQAQVIARGYRGYMEQDIKAASNKPEPQRSEALRVLKVKIVEKLRGDLRRYRALARKLQTYREKHGWVMERPECHDIHTGLSLKFAHLYSDFAHLNYIKALPDQHRDMFDLL